MLGADLGRTQSATHDVAFHDALGMDEQLRVLVVAEGMPAARAGLEPGDVILEVDGRRVDQSWEVFDELGRRKEPTDVLRRRGVSVERTRLEPVLGCACEIEYAVDSGLTMGLLPRGHAFVTSGFIDFVRDDAELAVVVAHELAHRVLGDVSPSADLAHELDADRIGLFVAARAGYDVSVAPGLWERVAIEKPWMIVFEREDGGEEESHGRIGKRLPAMRRVIAEIEEAQARGAELRP